MLADWETFFATAGGAAATLAGLLFVGTSLQLHRIASQPSLLALITETTLEFGLVLLGSLLLLMGDGGWIIGVPLAALGILEAVGALVEWRRAGARGERQPSSAAFRLGLPVLCGLAVVAGAVGLGSGWPWAPHLLALTMVALLGLGLRNALDLLLQMDPEGADDGAPTPTRLATARRPGRAARK